MLNLKQEGVTIVSEIESDDYGKFGWIFDPEGKVFKVVKFATDITAQHNRRVEGDRIGTIVDQNLGKIVDAVDGATRQSSAAASSATEASATVQTPATELCRAEDVERLFAARMITEMRV